MSLESVIQDTIEKAAKAIIPVLVTEGTVTKVDKTTNTCRVERDELPELFNVRLNAITTPGSDVVTIYPNVGSKVLVLFVENNQTDGYILSVTDIEEVIINGGQNGGIAISQKLIDELKGIKDDLNSLKNLINSWAPANGDGGAALKLILTDWIAQSLPDPDPEAIINTKVKH
ncbi:hypothetical protein [Carboxylicivirga linearis]|uniref:Phage protein Gp138 N-terminal domain-containing protein n=1 Tax=Carboxylicivirga linearis TaxID=1628157 RepID=A0ABS5K0L0_9BACT|nr:hypothetical protein [Carboxylicivirga linearis]MBS2100712.1 hypothetical protein [Carboxylicivirga linearis]